MLPVQHLCALASPGEPPAFPEPGSESALPPALRRAAEQGRREGLAFAGHVSPDDAWALVQAGLARLVDVRSPEERRFVGRVPVAWAVAWATGLDLQRNPDFLADLAKALAAEAGQVRPLPLLMLCRSGVRSIRAAEAATAAGHAAVFNVLEGFEGSLDEQHHRGRVDGWRLRGLPWEQS